MNRKVRKPGTNWGAEGTKSCPLLCPEKMLRGALHFITGRVSHTRANKRCFCPLGSQDLGEGEMGLIPCHQDGPRHVILRGNLVVTIPDSGTALPSGGQLVQCRRGKDNLGKHFFVIHVA